MFEMLDQLRDLDPELRHMGDELAAAMIAEEREETPLPEGFMSMAAPAYLEAVCSNRYWFSCDELLWIAECAGANVVVAKGDGRYFIVHDKVESRAGQPFAVVALNAEGHGRVRSHFERLCPEEWLVRATAEAREARLAAAEEKPQKGRGREAPAKCSSGCRPCRR